MTSSWLELLPMPAAFMNGSLGVESANSLFVTQFAEPGAALDECLASEDRAIFRSMAMRALSSADRRISHEFRINGRHGAKWFRLDLSLLGRRLTGIAPEVLVLATDISETKATEAYWTCMEDRWAEVLATTGTAVWGADLVSGQVFFSSTWRQLRGLDPDTSVELPLEDIYALIHPEDVEEVRGFILGLQDGDEHMHCVQYRLRHANGAWIWIECRASGFERGENGRPRRIAGTDIDITERKRVEESLARMSKRLRVALDASKIGVFEADIETGKVEWDDGMFRAFGIPKRDEVRIGGLWEHLVHPDDRERVFTKITHQIDNLLPFYDEYRVRDADGAERFIRARTIPFIDQDGHRRMIGANWDVTEDLTLRRDLEASKRLAEARNAELEAAKAEIERIAMLDPLTDLPNRRYLDTRLAQLATERPVRQVALLHVDLDRFKQINDTFGHNVGDKVLQRAATVLSRHVKGDGFAARIGGDEFVLIVSDYDDNADLSAVALDIIEEMRRPVTIEGNDCRFGASIGIADSSSGDSDPRQLLLNSDIALYHAKGKGRNRYEFFTRESRNRMESRRQLSDEILRGLERDEFLPYYQPQFSAAGLDLVGVETLVRWQHPQRGLLTPDQFLPIAEDLDIVGEIDRLVLEQALIDIGRWTGEGFDIPKCSVNVSSHRLQDPKLMDSLANLPILPRRIAFELLESTFLDDYGDQVAANLEQLRQIGINIEVDDFGTGYASIVSLLRLRPDTLKIDRQLTASITSSPEQRDLVRSIIHIGHSLGISVLAEGVETWAHVEILKRLKCDVLQGFGLGRPMPAGELVPFAKAQSWRRAP